MRSGYNCHVCHAGLSAMLEPHEVVDGVLAQVSEFDPNTFAPLNANVLSPAPGDKVVDIAFRL